MRIDTIDTPDALPAPEAARALPRAAGPGVAPLDPDVFRAHAPDVHLLARDGAALLARASLWYRDVPHHPGARVGVIGHYACGDPAAAAPVLEHALAHLARAGCTLALGPMDGNTWRSYRFTTEDIPLPSGAVVPPFFLEPRNDPTYPEHFRRAGLAPFATYCSSLQDDLGFTSPRSARLERRITDAGIRFASPNAADMDDVLDRIYTLSLQAFADNLLYTPIERGEFLDQYRRILPVVRPELITLAEHDGALAGFIFALPDLLQAERGEPVETLVVKTLAVAPAWRGRGLGAVLLDRAQHSSRDHGYRRAVHALMHDDNRSRALSGRAAAPIRRYTLFARSLA